MRPKHLGATTRCSHTKPALQRRFCDGCAVATNPCSADEVAWPACLPWSGHLVGGAVTGEWGALVRRELNRQERNGHVGGTPHVAMHRMCMDVHGIVGARARQEGSTEQ